MSGKDRLIKKLLEIAKKNRMLTYPALALVSVISIFSYFFDWSTGAGKRVIAVIMALVMLVSQSYFLTSSAETKIDTPEAVNEQMSQNTESDEKVANTGNDEEQETAQLTQEQEKTEGSVQSEESQNSDEVFEEPVTDADESDMDNPEAPEADQNEEDISVLAETETAEVMFTVPSYAEDGTFLGNAELYRIPAGAVKNEDGTYSVDPTYIEEADKRLLNNYTNQSNGCYRYYGWYTESDYSDDHKVVDDGWNHITMNRPDVNRILLFATRVLTKYQVFIDTDGGEIDHVVGATKVTVDGNTYYEVSALDGDGSFTIVNPKKEGYSSAGANVSAGSGSASKANDPDTGETMIHVTLTGAAFSPVVTLLWAGEEYAINYATSDKADATTVQRRVIYGETGSRNQVAQAEDISGVKDAKPGYEFDYWVVDGMPTSQLKGGEVISGFPVIQSYLYQNRPGAVLRPHYKYKGIKVDKEDIRYQYKLAETEDKVISGQYDDEASSTGNFTYSLTENGKTAAEMLRQMGILVTVGNDGIHVRTDAGGPTSTNESGIEVEFMITDENVDNPNEAEGIKKDKITISIDKRSVKIQDSKEISKIYDGTVDCELTNGRLSTDVEGVYVTFSSCVFDEPDAGERKVYLYNPQLEFDDAADSGNYKLVLSGPDDRKYMIADGVIYKRKVFIKTQVTYKGSKPYARAGEKDNPILTAIEDEAENNSGQDFGFLNDSDRKRLNEWVTLYPYPDRDDEAMLIGQETGDYKEVQYGVLAKTNEESNYEFAFNVDDVLKDVFTVRLESPIHGEHYNIPEYKSSDWNGADTTLKIIPTGGYNKVRMSLDDTWNDTVTLTEENTPNNRVLFQLYDSETGAFTLWKDLEIKIDLSAPEYVDYTISTKSTWDPVPGNNGLFFPAEGGNISFGNYFNKTVRFTVRYKDTRSNPGKLYYVLSGTLGGSNGEQWVPFGEPDADGVASASFEVYESLEDKIGQIQVYAEDKAGNQSDPVLMRRNGSEWAVESTGPSITDPLIVKSGEMEITNGHTDMFYANCHASVSAHDETSGIYSVIWLVNGTPYEERVADTSRKIHDITFTTPVNEEKFKSDNGLYELYAVIRDNAGNLSVPTEKFIFNVDDETPVVDIKRDYDGYQQKVTLRFSAYDELSGVKEIIIKNKEGVRIPYEIEKVEENEAGFETTYCYVEISTKGEYTIEVSDYAGNVFSEMIILDKVSSEVPPCPKVTILPGINEKGWITGQNARVVINNVTQTQIDKTEVVTQYQLWKNGETPADIISLPDRAASVDVPIDEGEYTMRVWSESRTGVACDEAKEESHLYSLRVDTVKPVIEYKIQKGSGDNLLITFTVTDEGSGVDKDSILVMHNTQALTVQISESQTGSGYTGSFVIDEVGDYTIQAADYAGNVSGQEAFTPMSMKVSAVKNISDSSATVGANIIKGTFDIESASIAYRKDTDKAYIEGNALTVPDVATGNLAVSAVLDDLQAGTAYVYKITAVSAGNEVLEYEGYFRTLSVEEEGITISGTARYADNRAGKVTVGILKGNECIRAAEVNTEESNTFTFLNVPDGNYSLVATDGIYSKTIRITISDGIMVYPENSILDLVLSGKNTSVVITTDETPDITADNMDSLLDDVTNMSDSDLKLIEEEQGTVEFKLYATLMRVSSVNAATISAMYDAATSKNKVVGAYIDLSLYKIVTEASGKVTRTQVSKLGGGANVSVTIPLGDLAGKSGLEVIRVHQDGDTYTGAYLIDQDKNPSTYTITTTQFSTYAVLYDRDAASTTEEPSTEDTITDGTMDPSDNGNINTTEDNGNNNGNTSKQDPANGKSNSSKSTNPSLGSLKSSGSAKTGDESPVAAMGIIMLFAVGGIYILRKKQEQI